MIRFNFLRQFNQQSGYSNIIVIFLIVLGVFFFLLQRRTDTSNVSGNQSSQAVHSCRPEESSQTINFLGKDHKLVKSGVYIPIKYLSDVVEDIAAAHLLKREERTVNGKTYFIYTPGTDINPVVNSTFFLAGGEVVRIDDLADKGFIFATYKGEILRLPLKGWETNIMVRDVWSFDIYHDVSKTLPSALLKCQDVSNAGQIVGNVPTIVFPSQTGVWDQKQLQLKHFVVIYSAIEQLSWWSPECKPAIYLYPKEKTEVLVKVEPKGFLTYTKPPYPSSGWQVVAYPSGKILTKGSELNYLYYESKIKDSEIKKPTAGYVVEYDSLNRLYDSILPNLGLSKTEAQDFKDYWRDLLPKANYYFVGIMEDQSIEHIEPLTITPKPDTIIRVRLYFEALDKKIDVVKPSMSTPKRQGFTVVEWGGIVKTDKDSKFTCSQ